MEKRKGERTPRLRRLAGVAGGVAATALCLSFAWSVVGGALRPAMSPVPESIVIATASQPGAHPPLAPFRKPAPPRASAKYATPDTRKSLAKPSSSSGHAAAATTPDTPTAATASTISLAVATGFLLNAESKASRTRGQPAQD